MMRRFTIARMMFAVAFLGANFAALRLLLSSKLDVTRELLDGFLPLGDALLVSLYVVASRYRVRLRWRRRLRRGRRVLRFAAFCALFLTAALAICLFSPETFQAYLTPASDPAERLLRSLGVPIDEDTVLVIYVLLPTFLGILLSGPPLLVAAALASSLGRFTLIVTPRQITEDASCDASAS